MSHKPHSNGWMPIWLEIFGRDLHRLSFMKSEFPLLWLLSSVDQQPALRGVCRRSEPISASETIYAQNTVVICHKLTLLIRVFSFDASRRQADSFRFVRTISIRWTLDSGHDERVCLFVCVPVVMFSLFWHHRMRYTRKCALSVHRMRSEKRHSIKTRWRRSSIER